MHPCGRNRFRAALLAIALTSFSSVLDLTLTTSFAAEPPAANALSEAEKRDGWQIIFNGKDFSGWHSYSGSIPPTTWTIADGCIKSIKRNGRPGGADLLTDQEFTDFEFSFEWKIAPGGNGGVKYFVIDRRNNPGAILHAGDDGRSAVGFEYQLLDDDRHPDAKNGPMRQAGALYSLLPPNAEKKLNPVGQFNQSRILVRGNHVEHWLNGAKILQFELQSPELTRAISASKYKPVPAFGTKFPTSILLQDHGEEISFRNLKFRGLTADKK
jgi:hypothetical protein